MVAADAAHGHAVLPAVVLGLVMARHYQRHRAAQERLRAVAFAVLTPFLFLRGGLSVSLDLKAELAAGRAAGEAPSPLARGRPEVARGEAGI